MKKPAFFLALTLLAAPAAFAQYQQFGINVGGSKRLSSDIDRAANPNGTDDNFRFGNSVKEIWYAVEMEPGTMFRLKAGQFRGPGAFQLRNAANDKVRVDVDGVDIDHVDADIDYRFSEAFGSTGLFAGIGFYRQSGNIPAVAGLTTAPQSETETNYGFQLGVNGDFPISQRLGVVVEGTYRAINYHARPRYVTVTGGLRFSF